MTEAQILFRQLSFLHGAPPKVIWLSVGNAATEAILIHTVKSLVATLDKFKVPEKEKNDVLTAVSGLKGDIVGR